MTSTKDEAAMISLSVKDQIAHMRLEGQAFVAGAQAALAAGNALVRQGKHRDVLNKDEQRIIEQHLPYKPDCISSKPGDATYRFEKPQQIVVMGMALATGCHAIALQHRQLSESTVDLDDLPEEDATAIRAGQIIQKRIKGFLSQATDQPEGTDIFA